MNEIAVYINDRISISMDEEQYYEYVDYMYELEVDRRLECQDEERGMINFTKGPLAVVMPLSSPYMSCVIQDRHGHTIGNAYATMNVDAKDNALVWSLAPDMVKVLELIIDASDLHGFDPGEILASIEEAAEAAEEILEKLDG